MQTNIKGIGLAFSDAICEIEPYASLNFIFFGFVLGKHQTIGKDLRLLSLCKSQTPIFGLSSVKD